MANPLFDRWQEVATENSSRVAMGILATGEELTFAQLMEEADRLPLLPEGEIHPYSTQAGGREFVLQTLRAWRDGAVLLPSEGGNLPTFPNSALPAGTVHLKLTSGSTGSPQLIAFTADQLAADATQICISMGLRRDWPNVGVISLAHSYGFSNLVLPLLLHGLPLWLAESALPGGLRAAFSSLRQPCTLPAVPAMWRAWHGAGVLPGAPVTLAISAGAPLPVELEQAIYESGGLKIHNFYGSSECGGIAYDATEFPRTDAKLAGTAMHGVTLETGADGCLCVRSAATGLGYWSEKPGPSVSALRDGVFHTSDIADLSAEGSLYLMGRQGDVIHMAGRKLNPGEVEAVLLSHPAVRHCVVFGIPSADPLRQEEIVACVHLDPSAGRTEIEPWLRGQLPAWKCPRHWWWRDDLTPNVRGKIPRAEWRQRFLS